MSTYELKNEALTVTIDTHGAEITSIRDKQGTEYIWNADPVYWKRHTPVLFPFVGSLKNKEYRHNGISYPMGQHGFARDMEFILLATTDTEARYLLKADDSTKARYPFEFELEIVYRLEGSSITVVWEITNCGSERMPFSIGAHPAFNCPLAKCDASDAGLRSEYEFRFDNEEPMSCYLITDGGVADTHTDHALPETKDHVLTITDHLFDKDALIIEHDQAHRVELAKKGEKPYITVLFDAPLFGLWSPAGTDAPFVCIEPWWGRCDAADFDGELSEREYGQFAEAGETQTYSYSIKIG